MGKVFLQGAVLLVAGIVVLAINQVLNLGLGSITFGLAVGGVLGLVSDGGPVGRIGSFLVGVVVALVHYLVQVLFLNGSFAGLVVTLVIAFGLITVICALTSGRLPLWAALLGVALVVGAYEAAFVDSPQDITTQLFQYTTMALVPAAIGFLAVIFVADKPGGTQRTPRTDEPTTAVPAQSEV